MPVPMTRLSAAEYDHILYGHLTPGMAVAYLREERIPLRSFAETLRSMYTEPDLLEKLTKFYLLVEPEQNQQSLNRKLRNWLSGRNQPSSRDDFFRIAFALRLDEQQLNHLLGAFTGYGIQYRSGREVAFVWFLRNGYGYLEAREFFGTLPPEKGTEQLPQGWTSHLTHEVQNEFQMVQTTQDLRACYLKNIGRFGSMHLRSYYYFERYLDQLIHPAPAWDGEREADYSIETVMNNYLSMQMPAARNRSSYTLIQKLIKQNWPNATALKNIRNHVEDVPRKLLILLYVVTENGGSAYDPYRELDETYITLEERVEDHWWTLNAMLNDCGMAPLDTRNPFDWLILYAIAADDSEFMSDRMEQVIARLFDDEEDTEPRA